MINTQKKIIIVLIVIALVVGGVVLLSQQTQWQKPTPETISISKTETYQLVDGWNFIAFPMSPVTVTSARELIEDVGKSGGYVSTVSRWNGDRWQEVAHRGDEYYGTDFELKAGEAYFVLNHQEVAWQVVGQTNPALTNAVALRAGWNAIGIVPGSLSKAVDVLDQTNSKKRRTTDEIDQWVSGNWQMLVKRWYSETNVQEYGDNFPLSGIRGYMIRAYEPITLRVAE